MKALASNIGHFSMIITMITVFACVDSQEPDKIRTPIFLADTSFLQDVEVAEKEIYKRYDKLVDDYKTGLYFENWEYDSMHNNISWSRKENKAAALESHNHILGLAFKDFIAKENRMTLKFHPVSPFANLDALGVYSSPLLVNEKEFSGVLIGTHLATGKKILEVRFYEGIRVGPFKVWTNHGRMYSESYMDNIQLVDINVVRKPVIYLYPEKEMDVNVKLLYKGELTHSYPIYPYSTGWNIAAQPNGMLKDKSTGKIYPYLFWEGKSSYQYNLIRGFVVKGKDVANFFDEKLELLGLNRREATDFISYWLPELAKNPYNLIHFSTEEYQQNAPLKITPSPEVLIRVFMVYKPLMQSIDISTQKLIKVRRKGFTVVEWGGMKASEIIN